jgi:hypothetical protein
MTQSASVSSFDYSALDNDTAQFVQEQTGAIRAIMRRTTQDILEIGQKLINVKARLGHGNFLLWLEAEFALAERTAQRLMNVTETFHNKNVNLSDLNFASTALYILAAPSTPDEARDEAVERASKGETITRGIAQELKQKYSPSKTQPSKSSQSSTSAGSLPSSSVSSSAASTASTKSFLETKPPEPKPPETKLPETSSAKPLEIVSISKASDKAWTQLGNHWLFNGHPNSPKFEARLPKEIILWLSFPPGREDWKPSLDFSVKNALSLFLSETPQNDDFIFFQSLFKTSLELYTEEKETVVFGFLPLPSLLIEAHQWSVHCFIAEPDADRCSRIIDAWAFVTS